MFKILKSKFLSNKKIQLSIACLLALIVALIAFSGSDSGASSGKTNTKQSVESNSCVTSYEESIETRIESIVNSISGISDANAFVYTKGSIEIIYGEDVETKTAGSGGETVVESKAIAFSKDGSTTTAVIVTKKYPEIEGVLVVAKGADDEKKRIMIINALASVLGININSIEVLSG